MKGDSMIRLIGDNGILEFEIIDYAMAYSL